MNFKTQYRIDMLLRRLNHLRDIWTVGNYYEVKEQIETIQTQIQELKAKEVLQ